MKSTEVLLVGTGAVGSYFGGKLSQSDARVSALCRSDYEAAREKGIVIRSYKGDFVFNPAEVIQSAEELSVRPDYILICLKALPDIRIEEIIRDAVYPQTVIVLIQNGIGIEQEVAQHFPKNQLVSGIAFIAVSRVEPGIVRHTGSGKLVLGNYPSGSEVKTRGLAKLFRQVDVPCDVSEDIMKDRWQKMVWNAAFNPISVLGGNATSKQMVENRESEVLVRQVMQEIMDVAAATGHPLEESIVENAIAGNHKMRPFKTSMLVDYQANRPMEVEAILGNTMKIAREVNIPVPHLETLYGLLKLQMAVIQQQQEEQA